MIRTKQVKELKSLVLDDTTDGQLLQYDNASSGYVHVDPATLSGSSTAVDTTYDNATSGLTSTDVQSAIDEVEGRVDTLESDTGGTADTTTTDTTNFNGNLSATEDTVQKALDVLDDINVSSTAIKYAIALG